MEALDTFMCPWLGLKRRGKESSKRSYSLSLSLSLSVCLSVCLRWRWNLQYVK